MRVCLFELVFVFTSAALCACVCVCARLDLRTLPVDFVECLMRFIPTEAELKVLRQYEKERKPLENLTDEDRFMIQFSKIERLMQKMTIMAFVANFTESVQMLTPVRADSTLAQELSRIFLFSLQIFQANLDN